MYGPGRRTTQLILHVRLESTATNAEGDLHPGFHGSIIQRLQRPIPVKVNYTPGRVDRPHVSVDANGVHACSFDFLQDVGP